MNRIRSATAFAVLLALAAAGCSTCSRTDRVFVAKGYSLNFLFLQIPEDPLALAEREIPAGAQIENVNVLGNEILPILGLVNRLFGISCAQIGGVLPTGAGRPSARVPPDPASDLLHASVRGTRTANARVFHLLFLPEDPLRDALGRAEGEGVRRITNVGEGPFEWTTGGGLAGNLFEAVFGPYLAGEVGGTP